MPETQVKIEAVKDMFSVLVDESDPSKKQPQNEN